MVRQSVKRSTRSMGASNSHETANSKTTCTRPSKQVIKPASGTKRTINLDDALAISLAPKPKRRKTKDAEILARYQELDDEEAADSEVDRNAQLCVLRDILSYMHGHSTYDKKLLDGYSMLQYLLYTQFFAENQYLPQTPIQARKSNTVRLLTDVLSAYGEAAKKYMNDKDRGVESRDALQELHHAMRWGLCLLALGKWQPEHPDLMTKPFHCAVALYICRELVDEDDDDFSTMVNGKH